MKQLRKLGLGVAGIAMAVVLTACASSNGSTASTGTAGASASDLASGSSGASAAESSVAASPTAASSAVAPTPAGPTVPAPTAVAAPVPASQLPAVAGAANAKPTLTFPKSNPPNTLQRKVLTQGTGATLSSGDYAVVNYLGQIWNGKVFDNSYDKKATFTFHLGASEVVSGWDVGLVGQKAGSRILLSLPPSAGYGSAGSTGAGIKGTDTIVFVIDIVSVISQTQGGQTNAVQQTMPAGIPTVTGALGQEPKITIPSGLAEPVSSNAYIVAKGTGAIAQEGKIIAQISVVDWDGTNANSTWGSATATSDSAADPSSKGAQEIQITSGQLTDKLKGIPIGSRVLLTIPAVAASASSSGQASPSEAAVIDIVAQYSVGTS